MEKKKKTLKEKLTGLLWILTILSWGAFALSFVITIALFTGRVTQPFDRFIAFIQAIIVDGSKITALSLAFVGAIASIVIPWKFRIPLLLIGLIAFGYSVSATFDYMLKLENTSIVNNVMNSAGMKDTQSSREQLKAELLAIPSDKVKITSDYDKEMSLFIPASKYRTKLSTLLAEKNAALKAKDDRQAYINNILAKPIDVNAVSALQKEVLSIFPTVAWVVNIFVGWLGIHVTNEQAPTLFFNFLALFVDFVGIMFWALRKFLINHIHTEDEKLTHSPTLSKSDAGETKPKKFTLVKGAVDKGKTTTKAKIGFSMGDNIGRSDSPQSTCRQIVSGVSDDNLKSYVKWMMGNLNDDGSSRAIEKIKNGTGLSKTQCVKIHSYLDQIGAIHVDGNTKIKNQKLLNEIME